jgi:hypothetical protein
MKTLLRQKQMGIFILICNLFLTNILNADSINLVECKPSLEIGQTWYVEVETLTEAPERGTRDQEIFVPKKVTYGYSLKMEKLQEIEGELCYQTIINLVTLDGNDIKVSPREYWYIYRIYNRVDDYSLKMVQRLSGNTEKIEASMNYSRGPINATDWVGFLPLDFPVFSQETQKFAPPDFNDPKIIAKHDMNPSYQKKQSSEDVWILNGIEKKALHIALIQKHVGSEMGDEITNQVWIKGLPWPIKAEYQHGKKPMLIAKLTRVNGSPLEALPQEPNQMQTVSSDK